MTPEYVRSTSSHAMAYPVPRFGTPKTPQHFDQSPEESPRGSPRDSMPRPKETVRQYKRYLLGIASTLLILLWVRSFKSSPKQTDRVPFTHYSAEDYFKHFEGHQDCGIASTDLYRPPAIAKDDLQKHRHYCQSRAALLEAMSGGGRHGFNAPFVPTNCHYRWYSTIEICMILERFDAIVFVGDSMLQQIYAAFNMLMRENMAMGSLKQWDMSEDERVNCRCGNQITRTECSKYAVLDSEEVGRNDPRSGHPSPYHCNRTPHYMLPITTSPSPKELHDRLTATLAKDPDSYKPVPIIHTLGLATSLSWPAATASMDEWLAVADASARNIPFLWLGPNAAGHLKPPGQIMSQGNNAIWHYTIEMEKEARSRGIDALGLYNLTLQAGSWDGSNYAQGVLLVEAMMIINWLSRIETT